MTRGRALLLAAFGAVLWLGAGTASAAPAELKHVESVGAVPADAPSATGTTLRHEAVLAGLADAVQREAMALAHAAGVSPDPKAVAAAIGDPTEYAVRYRLLEDRGRRPRLLVQDPDVDEEYDVLMEAVVDIGRLRTRLRQAGLLGSQSGAPVRTVRVTLEGLHSYPAYRVLRDVLGNHGRAVRPVEFEPGQAVLAVDTTETPSDLLDALQHEAPAAIQIVPLPSDDGGVRVHVAVQGSLSPAPAASGDSGSTPGVAPAPREGGPGGSPAGGPAASGDGGG